MNKDIETFLEKISSEHENIVTGIEKSYITESVFKNKFIPMFDNTIESYEDYAAALNAWLDLSNGPTGSVNIIDDETEELLFTTPPVMNTLIMSKAPDINKTTQLDEIFPNELLNTSLRHQNLSNQSCINYTEAKVPKILGNMSFEDNATKWNKIIAKYSSGQKNLEISDNDDSWMLLDD